LESTERKKPVQVELKEREKEILAVAAQLFAREGFETVAVRHIAEAVGLSKATLYHYFKDKDEIYARIVIDTLAKICVYVEERVAGGQTNRERLIIFMEATATFFEENIWAATAMLLGLGGLNQPHQREKAAYWRDRHEHNLRAIIQAGIAEKEFRAVNPAVTGRAILSTLNWMGRWYKPDGPTRAREFALEYAGLFLDGLTGLPASIPSN
jgi:TetR/AcrR family transcriptional regulator, cholesterol catabolism regulator